MKNKLNFFNKYGLALVLLIVGFLGFSNNFYVSAYDYCYAKSGIPDTTGYSLYKTITSSDIISANELYETNILLSDLRGKTVLFAFSAHPNGGDTRDVYLLEDSTYVEVSNFANDNDPMMMMGINYGDIVEAGFFDYSGSTLGIVFMGQTTYFEGLQIKVYVKDVSDELEPVISTEKYIYITGVSNPTSIDNMREVVNLTARDDIDGDLTNAIVLVSDGGYNTNVYNKTSVSSRVLGDYAITFSVTDSSDNTATCVITIRVVDSEKPVINLSTSILTYNVGYSGTSIADTTILDGIKATDNFSSITKKIVTNNYSNNENKIGSYTVVVSVFDSSGNVSSTTVTITVYDNVKPVITGSSTFYKSYDVAKSLSDIIQFCSISASDGIDGTMTIANGKLKVQSDSYTGKSNVPGTYNIVLRATDSRGNYADFTITVTIGDDVIPFFLINKNKVVIESGVNLSSKMLVQVLKDNGIISNKSLSYTVYNDSYTGNEEIVGVYDYDLKVLYEDGKEEFVELEVEVLQGEEKGIQVDEEKPNIFVKIWNWIKNIFSFVLLK